MKIIEAITFEINYFTFIFLGKDGVINGKLLIINCNKRARLAALEA